MTIYSLDALLFLRGTSLLFHIQFYRFNVIPNKLLIAFFTELEQKIFTICMETQKTVNSQSNLKKNGVGGIRLPDFRLYYKATLIKTV